MKIALVLFACFFSLTWQQNVFWSFPARRIPYYFTFNQDLPGDFPIVAASDPSGLQLYPNYYGYDGPNGVEERTLGESGFYQRLKPNAESRSFGLNYLASVLLSSLRLSSTSTSYTTTTSTITAATVVTCFTKTMFNATTACRRKRDGLLMIASMLIGDTVDENEPNGYEDESDSEIVPLPREGRDIDPAHLVTSSKTEKDLPVGEAGLKQIESSVDSYFRQYRNVILTSSLTTYSVSYSTSTRIVTNLASAGGLSCVPSGFNLC